MAEDTQPIFGARLARLVGEFGDQPAALYQGAPYSWSYVGRISDFLQEALSRIDTAVPAALVLRQRPSSVSAGLSLWASGRCATFLSPLSPDQALTDDIRDLAPGIVIADREDWARSGISDACPGAICVELRAGLDEPIAFHRVPPAAPLLTTTVPRDFAAQIVTSGTTGPSKRYAITWKDLAPRAGVRDPARDRGVVINILPLFSIGGTFTLVSTLFGGRPLALMDRVDVVEWAGLIRDHRPRRAGAPPAVLRMVLEAKIPAEWLSSVKSIYTASAPLTMQLADEFEKAYGIPIVQGYGATEFLGGVTGWAGDLYEKWGQRKRGSVGRAFPGVKLRVVDSTTATVLGANELGNLHVDSPHRAQGVPPGWAPTNDLARIDEDDFVWIIGRSDDVIIRGGFKVQLPEVEAALMEHPGVLDACVVGLPDERLGTVPAALVVTDGSEPPDESDLIASVRRRLPPYMAPVIVYQQDKMPLNAMLKKDRPRILSLLEAEMQNRTHA